MRIAANYLVALTSFASSGILVGLHFGSIEVGFGVAAFGIGIALVGLMIVIEIKNP